MSHTPRPPSSICAALTMLIPCGAPAVWIGGTGADAVAEKFDIGAVDPTTAVVVVTTATAVVVVSTTAAADAELLAAFSDE